MSLIIKPFGNQSSPFPQNQGLNPHNILLREKKIVSDDKKIATITNNCFRKITKQVNLKASKFNQQEKLVSILDTFKNHDSVERIKLLNCYPKSTIIFSKVT